MSSDVWQVRRLGGVSPRRGSSGADGEDASPERVIARARELSLKQALGRFAQPTEWEVENWDDVLEAHVDAAEAHVGEAPSPEE